MSKAVAKRETFEIAKVPYGILLAAEEADGDINALQDVLDFDFPNTSLSRNEIRIIMDHVAHEATLDATAGSVKDTHALTELISDSMYREVKRLTNDVRIYNKIAQVDPDKDVTIKSTGEVINSTIAQQRLALIMVQLTKYENIIGERKKAAPADAGVTNVNISLAGIMTEGLARIKQEEETIDVSANVVELGAAE